MKREKPSAMVEALRKLSVPLFTSVDVAKIVPDDNMFLFRAARKGYIKRIANKVYWNVLFSPEPPKAEQVACMVRQPSYVSCEWALNYHGILLQVPFVLTAITLHPGVGKRNTISYGDYTIEYSRIAERLYLPAEILNLDGIFMATPEKALLDAAYLRHRIPFAGELEKENVDREKLGKLAVLYSTRLQKLIEEFIR